MREAMPGLWSIPGCLAYGRKPLIPPKLSAFKARQGVRKAIREAKIFSLYTHLRSLGESESMLSNFQEILSYVYKKGKEGRLETKTMTELVKELSKSEADNAYLHAFE